MSNILNSSFILRPLKILIKQPIHSSFMRLQFFLAITCQSWQFTIRCDIGPNLCHHTIVKLLLLNFRTRYFYRARHLLIILLSWTYILHCLRNNKNIRKYIESKTTECMVYTAYKPQVLGGKTTPQGAAFSQLMRELLYLSTPKDFTLFNSMCTRVYQVTWLFI